MILICDTREQKVLEFPSVVGVTVVREKLDAGDYGARYEVNGQMRQDTSVCERKSISDLYTSFGANYELEKAKWTRAQAAGLTYVLAIEGTMSEVLAGHTYWQGGEMKQSQKSGIGQLRQLLTISRKYGITLAFCESRKMMALFIVEWFLAGERMAQHNSGNHKEA